jgi:uncharacterized membrane protein (DUF2068 family)
MPESKQRAPTLYAIIAIKLGKGILLLLVALGVYSLADNDLKGDYQRLLHFVHFDPEGKFFVELGKSIDKITPAKIYWVATGTAFYSLFSLVEGVGLSFRVSWAGWMAICESIFFIPIEVEKLIHGFSTTVFIILLINIFIVVYLVNNRHRLFTHHIHRKAAS